MWGRQGEKDDSSTLIAMSSQEDPSYGTMENGVSLSCSTDKNVFGDDVTRIDFVLVWEEKLPVHKDEVEGEMSVSATQDSHRKWRDEFLSKLRAAGIRQEMVEVQQAQKKISYVLLSAPWSVLCYYAEEISLRVPLQVVTAPNYNWSEKIFEQLSIPNLMAHDVPNPPPDFYTCQFRTSKLERFLGNENKDTFFKTTQRHQILYEILARTPYGTVKTGEVGIDRLLSESVFSAAYPLHEGPFEMPEAHVDPEALSLRQILQQYWARWGCWKKYQPLDHIREYFGEKIALYFAWLGFYTGWLLPAAVMGTVVFLFGIWGMVTDVPAKEICESDYVMCPLCNICSYWNMSEICTTFKTGLLFDNGGTVFFSIFMSLWAVTFLEHWKRTNAVLALRWDCSEFEDTEERPRPEFTAMAPMTMRNPVTGAEEPYFPEKRRFNRTLTSCMVIIMMVAVVLVFLIAIILYRTILGILIYKAGGRFFSFSAGKIASLSGSVLNLLVILMLSRVYTSLAQILTRWEMHRTQTKYEDMFVLKVFVFQFVNFYSSPIYIAFFKGRFVGYPGHYHTIFGIRNEDCGAGGCLIELAQELLVIMVGKQVINNIQEFICPKLKVWWHKRKLHPKGKLEDGEVREEVQGDTPWESDYQLLVCEGLFDEYLEMVIQFGFITIFVAACPLAPLFALINNWVEIRLDAQKFVSEYRRPVAERAQDIGIWLNILQVITQIAVISNAFLIAFTSDFIPRMYYWYTHHGSLQGFINSTLSISPSNSTADQMECRYRGYRDHDGRLRPEYFHLLAIRLGFVIIFEHVVFFVGHMIDITIPDIPEEVEIKVKREYYMAKEALAENQSLIETIVREDNEQPQTELRRRATSTTSASPPQKSDSPPPLLNPIPENLDRPGA